MMSPVLRRASQLFLLVALQAVLLFVCAGSLYWSAGWWYIGLYLALLSFGAIILLPNRSEVVAERSRGTAGGKWWDLWITRLMAISTLGLLVLAGLDERWNLTSPLPLPARLFGALAFAAGYALVLWAMYSNQYFSQIVRIQSERGHFAVTHGAYRLVRHPGYLGMTISLFGAVFLLDTIWGLVCVAFYLILIVTRTSLEDRTLRTELPGYPAYAARTKYRLFPRIW
jgi:protein-S-isoprenylcysteine O-methyltransferase Ste14